jgi:hypothetical protein
VGHEDDDKLYPMPTICVGTGDRERTTFLEENETGLRKLVRYHDWTMEKLSRDLIEDLATKGTIDWLEQKLEMLLPQKAKDLPSESKC